MSTSLRIREMQIKITIYYYTSTILAKIRKMNNSKYCQGHDATEPLHIADGNMKKYNHFRKQFDSSSTIAFLDLYPRK